MTADEFAKLLDGRMQGREITKAEEAKASESGIVVVFGCSDDCMEFRGAIDDEFGCYDGGTVIIDEEGLREPWHEDMDEEGNREFFKRERLPLREITAVWDEDGYSWIYETDLLHSTFEIFQGGEKYCRGIVFELDSICIPF